MRSIKPFALMLALAGAAAAVHAQKVVPGLWEITMNMQAGGESGAALARAQEQMAKMPPEQRKMMEEMMAKQGMAIGAGGMKNSIRYCMGKEQAERGDVPQDADGRCKRDSLERSGNTTRFKFTCTNPPSTGSGEFTLVNDKSYTMKMVVDSSAEGKARRMEMQQSGNWVGADCGNLKPRG